jgi:pimeloyl-ACP methyl ester carboxylesterase
MGARRILLLTAAALAGSALLATSVAAAPMKPTDYGKRAHWLHLPGKSVKPKTVAVFYVYPTAYARVPGGPIYATLDDPGMMQGAQVAYQRQATAFRTVGDIYAPYYRQIDATYQLSLPFAQQKKNIAGIPSTDVFAAFRYFLKHYDHGRPYILVGHSQGSAVLANLLAKYMRGRPAVYKRMIVAYVPGYPIQRSYLRQYPFLKFAKGRNDTGVIASWNTEAPTIAAPSPVVQPGAIAINPITWTRKQTEATAAKNRGSIELDPATSGTPFLNADGTIKRFKNVADARVDKARGVVICSTIDASAPPYFRPGGFPMGVLHTFDYPLYFFSVRANAADRVAHFFARNLGWVARTGFGPALPPHALGHAGGAFTVTGSLLRHAAHTSGSVASSHMKCATLAMLVAPGRNRLSTSPSCSAYSVTSPSFSVSGRTAAHCTYGSAASMTSWRKSAAR